MKAVLVVALMGISFVSVAQRSAGSKHVNNDTLQTPPLPTVSAGTDSSRATVVGGSIPYTKEVTENPEMGTLFMRYRFKKDGEDITFERTIKTRGKTEREKQQIIEATEQHLGLPRVQ